MQLKLFSKIYKIDDVIPGQQATVQGQIEKVSMRRSWKRQMIIAEAHIAGLKNSAFPQFRDPDYNPFKC